MAFDAFTLALIGIGFGTLFGAVNSIIGWLRSEDPFEPRKFAITVLVGIGAGLVLVFTQITDIVETQTNFDLLMQIAVLGFAIFGVNYVRSAGGDIISNMVNKDQEESE